MIKQHTTYYKDYSIKTYTETQDGKVLVTKRYNKRGNIIYTRFGEKEWYKWTFNKDGFVTKHVKYTGEWFIRKFDSVNKLIYEEDQDGVNLDRSKGKHFGGIMGDGQYPAYTCP